MSGLALEPTPETIRTRPSTVPSLAYDVALGNLRGAATVLVVAHHSFVAYCSFAPAEAPFADPLGTWGAFPVVDTARWSLFDPIVVCNDIYLMALMFFLSGLFVWPSLHRKGRAGFVRDRALRLGVPFLVAGAIVAPLAYYPSYLMSAPSPTLGDFVARWLALSFWPAGPVWFVWVLLLFDVIAAALYRTGMRSDERIGVILRRPARFFGVVVAITGAVYSPLALAVTPVQWTTIGPFAFQTSRLLFYAVWFAAGVVLSAHGIERTAFAAQGVLARQWRNWIALALVLFGVDCTLLLQLGERLAQPAWTFAWSVMFVLTCGALILGVTATFIRFARTTNALLDSLRDNAYGMYLVHYAFVTWGQYMLLRMALPGAVKGYAVFAGATAASWGTSMALRRIPAVRRIV